MTVIREIHLANYSGFPDDLRQWHRRYADEFRAIASQALREIPAAFIEV